MIKTILFVSTVISTTILPAFAFNPSVSFTSVSTPYGVIECLERAQKKLFSMRASAITLNVEPNLLSATGIVNNSIVGIWCRGADAIISISGKNTFNLRDEIKDAFLIESKSNFATRI